jgi:Fe(3+) dicitrate transport protein
MVYNMLSQQPGGLTDSMFALDAQKSYRSRNWFSTPWTTAAINAQYKINENSKLTVMLSGMWGDRNSVGYLGRINSPDTINAKTLQYNGREVAKDVYRNYSLEARYLNNYRLAGMHNTLSVGVRGYMGNTGRWQKGAGTTGTDYDMDITTDKFPAELNFNTSSYAVFAENIFRLTDKFFVIPGVRYESLGTTVTGRTSFNSDGTENRIVDETRTRSIFLAGVGAEYHFGKTELYANFTQNYRPMLFSDISAAPTTDIIDPNLKDASGYNVDLGYRGTISNYLFFDVSGFYLKYNNRLGTLAQFGSNGTTVYNFKTNVGNSTSTGVEALVEFSPVRAFAKSSKWGDVNVFASYGYTNAVYDDFTVRTYDNAKKTMVETNLNGNKVENAPEHILRSGLTYSLKGLALTYQYSYVSEAFSNSSNTAKPSADGTAGLISAYSVSDLTLSCQFNKHVNIKAGVNNLTDERYFTRRAGGYPGPGLLPADGRTFFLSVGAKF